MLLFATDKGIKTKAIKEKKIEKVEARGTGFRVQGSEVSCASRARGVRES